MNKKECSQYDEKKFLDISPFNCVGNNSEFTACVGGNGDYSQTTIYEGFVDAVNTLIDSVICYKNYADPMVYPILFCLRHSIELFLKNLYIEIKYIKCLKDNPSDSRQLIKSKKLFLKITSTLKDINIEKYNKRKLVLQKYLNELEELIKSRSKNLFKDLEKEEYTHDLNDLILKIKKIYIVDNRIIKSFDKMLPLLDEYKDIDPKGDAFRYWNDKEGRSHFKTKDIGLVRIDIIRVQFKEIENQFDKIDFLMWRLIRKYKTGTFTKELSRSQIEEISKLLPNKKEFANKIKEVKTEIKKKYNISSNKFDCVLKLIRKHREFSANIGIERPFRYISDNTMKIFVKCALGLEDWEKASTAVKPDELVLLVTFSDICGWKYEEKNYAYFSEDLSTVYAYNKYERIINYHDISPRVELKHVIDGMNKCGQITYVSKLNKYISEMCNKHNVTYNNS